MSHTVSILTPERAETLRTELVMLMIDAVEHGASINFVQPMIAAKADPWWQGALDSQRRGERLIVAAESEGRLDGSVQLILPPQENQPHRADIGKLMVHSRARRHGLGDRLMQAVEDEARRIGRTLLTLDTEEGSAAERLYLRRGWTLFGKIPGYHTLADNSGLGGCSFFYKAL